MTAVARTSPTDLEGQTALVTGGARGIGLAIARELATRGANVALGDLNPDVAEVAAELEAEWDVTAVGTGLDVTDPASVEAAFGVVTETLGPPTLLVNCAGITHTRDAIDVTLEEWNRVIGVNLTGTFLVCQAFARSCAAAASPGAVVNIASMSGRIVNVPQPQASYNASKAAVEALTKSLAVEWIPLGVRVNAVSPGYIASDMTRQFTDANPEMGAFWRSRIPTGEMGEPEDVAGLVAWLLSPAARYVVGQSFVIDGGYTIV
ncbi:SDR family oxidoreductase [Kineococcus sp. R8]|nr:SDR family oxidoreductase [Kineococcus siccus]